MSCLKDTLVESFESGIFLKTVYSQSLIGNDERSDLADTLASIHNENAIDVVAEFGQLKNDPDSGIDFFLTRHVFESVLPQIAAPIGAVLSCIDQLYKEAGHDLAAGSIYEAFIAFCEKDTRRSQDAIDEIVGNLEYLDLLPSAIIAGSNIDHPHYLALTLELADSTNSEIKSRAIFSLGRIKWPDGVTPAESIYAALEKALREENDDEILASIVQASFSLYQHDETQEVRITQLIEDALSKGSVLTLHAASAVFGFHTDELPDALLNLLLLHLRKVNSANKRTLDNIDFGVANLLKDEKQMEAITFIEELLLLSKGELKIDVFDSALSKIRQSKALMNKIATRWLFRGNRELCESVGAISGERHGENIQLEIDSSELQDAVSEELIFLARKAIGYLFFNPISAASILVSLIRQTEDKDVLDALEDHLFDPLLLNFTGQVRKYVSECAANESGDVRKTLDGALKATDDYLGAIRSIGEVLELKPSEAQREAYNRHFSRQMAAAFSAAEAQSVFLSMIDKQVLLYGRKSISYVQRSGGKAERMEIPLTGHGTEIEIPRMEQLDPFGLDYMLRVFRVEQRQE